MRRVYWITSMFTILIAILIIHQVHDYSTINTCLDNGGTWNYKSSYCDLKHIVALQFINDYTDHCNNIEDTISLIDWISMRDDVTPAFEQGLSNLILEAEKTDTELGPGYDPIFNAQDYPSEGYILAKNSDSSMVYLVGKNQEQFKLNVKVIKVEDTWLVDGISEVSASSTEL